MTSAIRTNWKSLIVWLMVCPALFLVALLLLTPQTTLYASWAERVLLLILFLLPLIGVVALFRQLQATRGVRILAAGAYLAITLPMVD